MFEITPRLIPGLPMDPYRNGMDAYEGVVAHATASYAPDENEVAFSTRNWRSAFVHFFVDPDSISQTALIAYMAWGAGHYANPRYVHVELCQVHNDGTAAAKAKFQASYDRYTWLLAWVLFRKGLSVVDGHTLVSHAWVSENLGGTDHMDPIEYLREWGLTWANLVNDVKGAYAKMAVKTAFTDLDGHWAKAVIEQVAGRKTPSGSPVLNGFPDGTFRPDAPLTRAQFAVTAARILELIDSISLK